MITHWLRRTFRPTREDIAAADVIARLDDHAEIWFRYFGVSGYRRYTLDRCDMQVGIAGLPSASVFISIGDDLVLLDERNARRVYAAVCRLDAYERSKIAARCATYMAARGAA